MKEILSRMVRSSGLLKSRQTAQEYHSCEQVRLVKSGSEFFDLLVTLIGQAERIIHLQTYIFLDDDTGKRIAAALEEAAKRNVKVYVLVDGYASQGLPSPFLKKLEEAGVHFQFFAPLLKSKQFYFGRRLHHKVVAIDERIGLVGGINISNNYNDTVESPAWLDWALYVEGDVAKELSGICSKRVKPRASELSSSAKKKQGPYTIRVRINDWVRRKREVTRSYFEMLRNSTSEVTIMSSYFIPGELLRRQMKRAVKRGVRIRVIMGRYSDVALARLAEQYMYRWLLRNKIEVYEYLPKIVHSKLAMSDGKWLTVGSYNVNDLSAYASIELNLDVNDPTFVQGVMSRLNRIIELDCALITEEEHKTTTTLWQQFLQRSAYDIFRLSLFVFTFYFKQRE